jgi:hypothetical protein
MNEQHQALTFANLAYSPPDQRQVLINSNDSLKGFTIDPQFNSDEHFVAVSHDGQHVFSSHRGTSNADDVTTDVSLAAGTLHNTKRYARSRSKSMDATRKYEHADLVEVGHSLGGTLADRISRESGRRSIVFNAGSSPFAPSAPVSQRHEHHRIASDIISSFAPATSITAEQPNPISDRLHHHFKGVTYKPLASKLISGYTGHLLKNFFH